MVLQTDKKEAREITFRIAKLQEKVTKISTPSRLRRGPIVVVKNGLAYFVLGKFPREVAHANAYSKRKNR